MRAAAYLLLPLLLLSPRARAADGFSLQSFRPAIDSKGFVTVNATPVLGHLELSIGLVSTYARHVLDLARADPAARWDAEELVTPQLQAALGLFDRFELGLSLPVHILAGSRAPAPSSDAASFSAQSLGDLGLHAKARLVDGSVHRVGLGVALSLYTPTGASAELLGEGQVTVRPALLVDGTLDRARRLRLGLDVGAFVRPRKHRFTDAGTGQSRALGSQLTYGLALSYAVVPQRLELIGEAFGAADLSGERDGHPLEGLVAAKVYLAAKSYFELGGGAGILPRAVAGGMTGAPELRVFLGFLFEPSLRGRAVAPPEECPLPDSDGDGLLDRDDECPHEPGPADDHGCPPHAVTRLRHGHIDILEPIHFETASAVIDPVSYGTLDAVATTMKQNPQLLVVEIQGHADERGNDDYNLRLTEARAAAVRSYLVEHGVAPERLVSHGYGETLPVCGQHDDGCWSRNRRVELVVRRRSDEHP
jgi:OOP family OmpA-OmpF porin